MLSMRGSRHLGLALMIGMVAGCGSSKTDDLGRASQAATAVPNLKAVIEKTNSWASGYCVNVNISTPAAAAASTWVVVLELNQARIYSSWNGNFTGSGSRKTVTPVGWNASVAAGATLQAFGYCANTTGASSTPAIVSPLGNPGEGGAGRRGWLVAGGGNGGAVAGGGSGGAVAGGGSGGAVAAVAAAEQSQAAAVAEQSQAAAVAAEQSQAAAVAESQSAAVAEQSQAAAVGGAVAGGGSGGVAGGGSGGAVAGQRRKLGSAGSSRRRSGGGAGAQAAREAAAAPGYPPTSEYLVDPDRADRYLEGVGGLSRKVARQQQWWFLQLRQNRRNGRLRPSQGLRDHHPRRLDILARLHGHRRRVLLRPRRACALVFVRPRLGRQRTAVGTSPRTSSEDLTPYNQGWDPNTWKWSFVQHYALLGIGANCDATHDATICGWFTKGRNLLDTKMWDSNPVQLGYYDQTNLNTTGATGKGFTATVDALTTNAIQAELLWTTTPAYQQRNVHLANTVTDRLAANLDLSIAKYGFPENYNANWSVNTSQTSVDTGHILKSAWVLARVYLRHPDARYRAAARKLIYEVLNNGGWDEARASRTPPEIGARVRSPSRRNAGRSNKRSPAAYPTGTSRTTKPTATSS